MTIYSFWMFDRHCNCVFTREWSRPGVKDPVTGGENTAMLPEGAAGTVNADNHGDTAKLLFGTLFSLRNIAHKLGTPPVDELAVESNPFVLQRRNPLRTFSTGRYQAHFMETALGLYFCLLAAPGGPDLQPLLRDIYADVYVTHVVKNAASDVDFGPEARIENVAFIRGVDAAIQRSGVAV